MTYFTDQNQGQEDQTQNQEDWLQKVVEQKGEQWADPQVLAKGYANAQAMIEQLKQTQEELRQDLTKQNYTEELLKEIRQGKAQPPAGEPNGQAGGTEPNGHTDQEVSEDKLKSLIEQTITQREQQNSAAQNLQQVDAKLTELFGTEVNKEMDKRAAEVGMSKQRLQELAAESPTAFFKLIGEDAPKTVNPVTRGTVNTDAASFANQSNRRDWAYYQNMRKQNPSLYYSPKVQNQILQDKIAMGDSFGNT